MYQGRAEPGDLRSACPRFAAAAALRSLLRWSLAHLVASQKDVREDRTFPQRLPVVNRSGVKPSVNVAQTDPIERDDDSYQPSTIPESLIVRRVGGFP